MVNFQIISLCEFFFFFKHKTAYELRISDWSSDVCSSYLKLWQDFHVADNAAPYLSKAFVDSRFDFTRALSGVSEQRPRWKRGLTLVDGSLGELVGREYEFGSAWCRERVGSTGSYGCSRYQYRQKQYCKCSDCYIHC